MAVALQVMRDDPTPSCEPCCHPVTRCLYRPQQIRDWLRDMDALAASGISPIEALQSVISNRDLYNDSPSTLTERLPKAAYVLADLRRAFKAGKRNPQEIARFLCPFSEVEEDD